ncbi:MAG: DUF3531 family protein, partial [Synechococcaceae bacterium WB4_2_0805]|nr:DUF3531 family protein [Synechococcaceae bacterium WB4_2_0805]
AVMHNMGEFEYQNNWARVWLDLGTSDGFGLDVLINALLCLNRDLVQIEELQVGGLHDEWPVEESEDRFFEN